MFTPLDYIKGFFTGEDSIKSSLQILWWDTEWIQRDLREKYTTQIQRFENNLEKYRQNNPNASEEDSKKRVKEVMEQIDERKRLEKESTIPWMIWKYVKNVDDFGESMTTGITAWVPRVLWETWAWVFSLWEWLREQVDPEYKEDVQFWAITPISEKIRSLWKEWEDFIVETTGQNKDFWYNVWKWITELASVVFGAWKFTAPAKIKTIMSKWNGLSKMLTRFPKITRYLHDALEMWKFTAGLNIVQEWDVSALDVWVSAAAFPLLTRAIWWAWGLFKAAPKQSANTIDWFHKKIAGLDDDLVLYLEKHPKIAESIFKEAKGKWLKILRSQEWKILLKKFPNAETQLWQLKNDLIKKQEELIAKWIIAEREFVEWVPTYERMLNKERGVLWKVIWDFKTSEVVSSNKWTSVVNFFKKIKAKVAPWTDPGVWINKMKLRVIKDIQEEAALIFGKSWLKIKIMEATPQEAERLLWKAFKEFIIKIEQRNAKITKSQLLEFHATIKAKAQLDKLWTKASRDEANLYAQYSEELSKSLNKLFWKEYTIAKDVFSKNIKKLKSVQKLLKEDIAWETTLSPTSLREIKKLIDNPEKLTAFVKSTWINKNLLINKLKEIESWAVAKKVIPQIKSNIQLGKDLYSKAETKSLNDDFVKLLNKERATLEKELSKLSEQNRYRKIVEKLFLEDWQTLKRFSQMDKSALENLKWVGWLSDKYIDRLLILRWYWRSLEKLWLGSYHPKAQMVQSFFRDTDKAVHRIIETQKNIKWFVEWYRWLSWKVLDKITPSHKKLIEKWFDVTETSITEKSFRELKNALIKWENLSKLNPEALRILQIEWIWWAFRKLSKLYGANLFE